MEITITIKCDSNELEQLKTMKEEPKRVDDCSQYARFFDDRCPGWSENPEYNIMFLKQQQNYLNAKLRNQGYLFLNDVYNQLGIPITAAGQCVGWLYDEDNPVGDNFVDFGTNIFRGGRDILLDFNVDGMIIDKI